MAGRTNRLVTREPIAALNRVAIAENHEPLVEIADGEGGILVRPDRRVWVRATLAGMLRRAQQSLPTGLHLYLSEGYRSLERQRAIYERFRAEWRERRPDWPRNILQRYVYRFVAPPHEKSPPGHCTGGAIDLSLVDDTGEEIDFVSPRGLKIANAPTWSEDISPTVRTNRELLFETMEGQGLKNYPQEWWHYSFGDSGWAVRTGRKTCFYGALDPPPEYEAPVS